jgi:hypothetical protein
MAKHNDNTAKGTVQIEIQIERQRLRDILTTAVEQGMAYWFNDYGYECETQRDDESYVVSLKVTRPKDAPDGQHWTSKTITDLDLGRSLGDAVRDKDAQYSAWQELSEERFDAATADCLVQFALFGKVIYG